MYTLYLVAAKEYNIRPEGYAEFGTIIVTKTIKIMNNNFLNTGMQ